MATFLANEINTTEGDITGPTAHAQITFEIIKGVLIVIITASPALQVSCRVECSLRPLPVEMQIANIFK